MLAPKIRILLACLASAIGTFGTTSPLPAQDAAAHLSACAPVPLDFWIVSSRCCPQGGCSCCALQCPLDYFHVTGDGCGQIARGDVAQFRSWMQPGVPVCLIAHGSLVTWESLMRDAGPIYRWLRNAAPDRPIQIVFFTWPSDVPIICPSVDFIHLGLRAKFNGFYLAQVVAQIPPESPVSYFGHSHGAALVASTLHLQAGGAIRGQYLGFTDVPTRPCRVVFVAAAVERDWLGPGETFERALWRADCLLNVYNSSDFALCFYAWRYPFSDAALGHKSFGRSDLRELGPLAGKVAEVDVSRMLGCGHMWENYYPWPQIASAIAPWVYFIGVDPCCPYAVP